MTNIKNLTEFNPAIIYSIEPESTPERAAGSEKYQDTLIPETEQYEDLLTAYLYAQNEILPQLRHSQGKIDEQQFLTWIHSLHGLAGKSLLERQGAIAGKYSERFVIRWHQDTPVKDEIIHFLSNLHMCKKDKDFANLLVKKFHTSKSWTLEFIKLIKKISQNSEFSIHESQLPFLDKNSDLFPGCAALLKLQTAYYEGKLSIKEKNIVDSIVKICMFPGDISMAMQMFAKDTLENFKKCDPKDLNQVTAFLADLYYEFTEKHPFANANGRIGVLFVNIFLRYFDLPSILLRHVGDKKDRKSLYFQAIEQITTDRKPLQELIKKRIISAQKAPFSDGTLQTLIFLRMELTEILKRIQKRYPDYSIDTIQNIPISKFVQQASEVLDTENSSILVVTETIEIAKKEEEKLRLKNPNKTYSLNKLNNSQIETFLTSLELLTDQKGWTFHQNNELTVWTKCSSEAIANDIIEKITKKNIAKCQCMKIGENSPVWVVKCNSIDVSKVIREAAALQSNENTNVSEPAY